MIYNKLYDWQKQVINENKDKKSYGLFLDCGLGKTPISLAFAEENNCEKVLIITINPKAVEDINDKGSWYDWLSQSKMNYIIKNKTSKVFEKDHSEALVINYESLFKRANKSSHQKTELKDNIVEFIKTCKGKNVAIIIDESHKVKNLQSLQTCAIFKIQTLLNNISNNLFIYLLSGTPFTTGYIDLYSQLKLLGCKMNKSEYVDNYCIRGNLPGLLGWQQPIVGYKNVESLYKLVHKYAITMKTESVIKLPEQIFVEYVLPNSLDFRMFTNETYNGESIYNYAFSRSIFLDKNEFKVDKKINNPFYANIDYPNERWIGDTSGNFWLRARQLSIGFQGNKEESKWFDRKRLEKLKLFLETNEDNYILFYNYTPELLELYEICDKLGYNIDVYCGEIKSLAFYERYSHQSEEQKLTNKKNIILANWSSGSTGLNLQEYNKCILFSIPLYSEYEQGIKRINRIGQKQTCIYYMFYQNNWLDKGMLKALQEGIDYSNDLFKSQLKNNQGENNEN